MPWVSRKNYDATLKMNELLLSRIREQSGKIAKLMQTIKDLDASAAISADILRGASVTATVVGQSVFFRPGTTL